MRKTAVLAFGLGALLMSEPAQASPPNRSLDEVRALFKEADARGLVGKARKTKLVDARPAKPGEVIVTVIAGEGKETESRPAAKGDWVVRNRCEATGHEQYLVAAARFKERYQGAGMAAGRDGWQEHRPVGKVMLFFVLTPEHGALGRAHGGEARGCDRAGPGETRGHVPRGGGVLRLHVRGPRLESPGRAECTGYLICV
jgi:hypothetical protein